MDIQLLKNGTLMTSTSFSTGGWVQGATEKGSGTIFFILLMSRVINISKGSILQFYAANIDGIPKDTTDKQNEVSTNYPKKWQSPPIQGLQLYRKNKTG
jgi:hypothetical protein